jgi:alkanesulfonate monooxygenase SsuD/methylene tetrahydromethanopterin reductase-like flavin-dependent oxidoreductase (luciferase family)
MENHGTVYKTRFRKLREQVAAVRAIWREEEASFHGDFVNFDAIWCYPKPTQKGGPPVIMGGMGFSALDRVIEYADGWLPIDGGMGPDALEPTLAEFERRVAASGRARASLPVSVYGVPQRPEAIDKYRQLGISRVVFRLRAEARDLVLPKLDRLMKLMA